MLSLIKNVCKTVTNQSRDLLHHVTAASVMESLIVCAAAGESLEQLHCYPRLTVAGRSSLMLEGLLHSLLGLICVCVCVCESERESECDMSGESTELL